MVQILRSIRRRPDLGSPRRLPAVRAGRGGGVFASLAVVDDRRPVEADVLLGGVRAADIGCHRIGLEALPELWLAEGFQRPHYLGIEIPVVVGAEDETVTGLADRVPVVDGVGEATGGTHDRD